MRLWGGVEHSPRAGFTLAEVLITLGIIGVVAAMTIPTLVANYQQRSMDTAANVFTRKLGEALKVMNSNSSLAGYNSTADFVKELGKNIKIVKTCDSNHLTNCFVSEFSTNDDTFKTEELKKSKNLNKDGNYDSETIGVQFADGVSALVAYNKKAKQDPYSNQVVNVTSDGKGKDLSIGLGTDALAILFDVSGSSNPNKYGTDEASNKWKDIRGVNISIKVGGDILILGSYSPINCYNSATDKKYCGTQSSNKYEDYWAGAQKACAEQGMRLPTTDELRALYYDKSWTQKPASGSYWTVDELSNTNARVMEFSSGSFSGRYKYGSNRALCVSN